MGPTGTHDTNAFLSKVSGIFRFVIFTKKVYHFVKKKKEEKEHFYFGFGEFSAAMQTLLSLCVEITRDDVAGVWTSAAFQ